MYIDGEYTQAFIFIFVKKKSSNVIIATLLFRTP